MESCHIETEWDSIYKDRSGKKWGEKCRPAFMQSLEQNQSGQMQELHTTTALTRWTQAKRKKREKQKKMSQHMWLQLLHNGQKPTQEMLIPAWRVEFGIFQLTNPRGNLIVACQPVDKYGSGQATGDPHLPGTMNIHWGLFFSPAVSVSTVWSGILLPNRLSLIHYKYFPFFPYSSLEHTFPGFTQMFTSQMFHVDTSAQTICTSIPEVIMMCIIRPGVKILCLLCTAAPAAL